MHAALIASATFCRFDRSDEKDGEMSIIGIEKDVGGAADTLGAASRDSRYEYADAASVVVVVDTRKAGVST